MFIFEGVYNVSISTFLRPVSTWHLGFCGGQVLITGKCISVLLVFLGLRFIFVFLCTQNWLVGWFVKVEFVDDMFFVGIFLRDVFVDASCIFCFSLVLWRDTRHRVFIPKRKFQEPMVGTQTPMRSGWESQHIHQQNSKTSTTYAKFAYIWWIFTVNVGNYTIHGFNGFLKLTQHIPYPKK